MQSNRNEKGFTIIEVVLVLAIAGLIFLIVFLALPQLQRSRRDTQRRNDAGRYLAALESYASNSNGDYPENTTEFSNFQDLFIDPDEYQDPSSGVVYDQDFAVGTVSTVDVDDPGYIYYGYRSVCEEGGTATTTGAQVRDVSVVMTLEDGVYCQDNR